MLIWKQKLGRPKNGGLSQNRDRGHNVHTKLRVKLFKSSCSTTGNKGAEAQVYYRGKWSLSGCDRPFVLQGHDRQQEDWTCPQWPIKRKSSALHIPV